MSSFVRAACAAVIAWAFAASASPAVAAPIPPDAGKAISFPFPAKAPVVLQIAGIGAAQERLNAMLKAALPDDIAEIQKQIDAGLKEVLADRKLTAIPKEGRVYVVLNDIASLTENTPALSLLVPVTGYKEFRETFLTADERKTFEAGKTFDEVKMNFIGEERAVYLVDLKEYIAITPDKTTAETYAGKFTRATTAAMPTELARSFVGSDLSLFVNLEVINELYGEQIKGFKGLIDFGLQQAQMGGMLPGINKKQLETAKIMLGGLFQAIEDGRGLVVGVELRPEGLNIRVQAQFADDTVSTRLLKAETPNAQKNIERLPAGLGQYAGWSLGKKFYDALRGLNPEFAPADDDEKSNEKLEKQQAALAAAGPKGELNANGTPDVNFTIASYAEPKKAVTAILGCYEAMTPGGRIQSAILKDAPKITEGARKHANFTFAEVKLTFDFEATVKDLPEPVKETTLAQLKRTFPEKPTFWIGTDGETVVQMTAKDWDTATGVLDGYLDKKKPLGDTEGYKITRKQLPQDASYLLMVETSQLVTTLVDSLRSMQDLVPGFPRLGKVKPLKGEPTYLGVAVTFKGDTATLNLFVPGPAINAAKKIISGLVNIE